MSDGELYKVGYASCNITPFDVDGISEKDKKSLRWIKDLTTEEKYRGKGLASNLLKQLGKEADQAQVGLILECRGATEEMDNERLESFYKRHGFVKIQDEPKLMMRTPVPPMLFEQLSKKKTSSIITNLYN